MTSFATAVTRRAAGSQIGACLMCKPARCPLHRPARLDARRAARRTMVTPVRADGSPPRELQEPRTCASCDRLQRRHATIAVGALLTAAGVQSSTGSVASAKDNFVTTSSGLRVLDFREGTGATPKV
eukprot:scaffold735_cov376-Prasinococcus_capsulatus_cf.AAC.20